MRTILRESSVLAWRTRILTQNTWENAEANAEGNGWRLGTTEVQANADRAEDQRPVASHLQRELGEGYGDSGLCDPDPTRG